MLKLLEYGNQSGKLKGKYFWIGLINKVGTADFVWVSDKTIASFNDRFWDKDQPSYDGPYVHTSGKTMLLNDMKELEINKPICQKALQTNKNKCKKDGWILQNGQCYKFMTKTFEQGCSWSEAVSICQELGAKLTEGPDFLFLRNIAKSLKTTTNWWVGFSDLKAKGNYVTESDGKQANLTNYFATGEPSSKKEHCIEMCYGLDMKLNDKNCNQRADWEKDFQPLCQL